MSNSRFLHTGHWPHFFKMPGGKNNSETNAKVRGLERLKSDIDAKPGLYTNYKPCLQIREQQKLFSTGGGDRAREYARRELFFRILADF